MLISYWSSDVCSSDLHHEEQRLAGLDHATGAAVAIAKVRRDDEWAAAADLHPLHTGVPARDDLADAEAELQRSAAVVGRIELLAAGVGNAHVVHRHGVAGLGLVAVALGDVSDHPVLGGLGVEEVDLGLPSAHAGLDRQGVG